MSWGMNDGMVQGPAPVDEHEIDQFFQVVPPTPLNGLLQTQQSATNDHITRTGSPAVSETIDPNGIFKPMSNAGISINPGRLRASDSQYSLRSHRSSLSIGSVDSHISAFSGAWSTSDSISESDYEPDSIISHTFTHHGQGHSHYDGQPSLSIDPKLFQPKENDVKRPFGPLDNDAEATKHEVDNGDLATAVPIDRSKKPTKARAQGKKNKGTGMTAEERKKVSHARKQPDHIPRPRNAFILFRKHVVDSKLIPPSVEMRHQNVSIITAKMWGEAPAEQKAHFNDLAKKEKEEHMKKYPGYRYQPVYRRTNVIRRRVRKDEAEEAKCRSVAELLLKGKSGDALANEIKEKIKRGEHFPAIKKVKAPTQRTSSASELSKGALRALKADARHQSVDSGDWSDLYSRDASIDPDYDPSTIGGFEGQELEQSYQGLGVGLGLSQFKGYQHHNGQFDDGMAYVHPALGGWNFGQGDQQQSIEGFSDWSSGGYQDGRGPEYAYPQPQAQQTHDQPGIDYQIHDHQVPFQFMPNQLGSPSHHPQSNQSPPPQVHSSHGIPNSSSMGSKQPSTHLPNGLQNSNGQMNHDFLPQAYPSPTSILYTGNTLPAGRWDTNQFALPPSSDISFGMPMGSIGMGLDAGMAGHMNLAAEGMRMGMVGGEEDLMLHDFGAALAQADEMADGEW